MKKHLLLLSTIIFMMQSNATYTGCWHGSYATYDRGPKNGAQWYAEEKRKREERISKQKWAQERYQQRKRQFRGR